MIEITTTEELRQFLNSHTFKVIKFSSESCGPCRAIEPHLQRLASENPLVSFASIDLATAHPVAAQFGVNSAPTFDFYHGETKTCRVVGADLPAISREILKLSASASSATTSTSNSSTTTTTTTSWPVPNALNTNIEKSGLELLNVGSTGQDLFGSGATTTLTHADSQLLAFVPFQNKVSVSSILLQVAEDSNEQRPFHIKVFASLPSALSFEDAQSLKALYEADIGEPKDGWLEIKLRLVHFQNIGSLLIFISGEDDDEPTAIQRIVLVGKAKEQTAGSLHEEE